MLLLLLAGGRNVTDLYINCHARMMASERESEEEDDIGVRFVVHDRHERTPLHAAVLFR